MSEHEPEATPQQQDAVRRLLADARHTGPVPPEVAARLDAALAGLEAPRAEHDRSSHPGNPVVDLAARRRRGVTRLLGAAAAVAVLGVGAVQVVDAVGSRSTDDAGADAGTADAAVAGSSESKVDDQSGPDSQVAPDQPSQPSAQAESGVDAGSASGSARPPGQVPRVQRSAFRESALSLRDTAAVRSSSTISLGAAELTTESMFVCDPTTWGSGRVLAVRYAGSPAVLVFRPATGRTQSVELLQCGSGAVLRSVVLPFP